MREEARVRFVDFGAWGGTALLAEYDAEDDTIRINARVLERVSAALGTAEAASFIASAVAHERFHRAQPFASEAAAHAHARSVTGGEPRRFEAFVRAGRTDERP